MLRIILSLLFVSPLSIYAQSSGRQAQQNNNNQNTNRTEENRDDSNRPTFRERIEKGLESGRLSQAEYDRLMKEQRELKAFRDGIRADGEVTETERDAIRQLRREQSQRIYNEKHDSQFEPEKLIAELTERIVSGVKNGSLAGEEFLSLDSRLQAAKEQYAAANSDGVVSKEEREALYPVLDKLQQDIYAQKHDKQNASLNMSNDLYQQIADRINQEYQADSQ